jgi:hypothetical protein
MHRLHHHRPTGGRRRRDDAWRPPPSVAQPFVALAVAEVPGQEQRIDLARLEQRPEMLA